MYESSDTLSASGARGSVASSHGGMCAACVRLRCCHIDPALYSSPNRSAFLPLLPLSLFLSFVLFSFLFLALPFSHYVVVVSLGHSTSRYVLPNSFPPFFAIFERTMDLCIALGIAVFISRFFYILYLPDLFHYTCNRISFPLYSL